MSSCHFPLLISGPAVRPTTCVGASAPSFAKLICLYGPPAFPPVEAGVFMVDRGIEPPRRVVIGGQSCLLDLHNPTVISRSVGSMPPGTVAIPVLREHDQNVIGFTRLHELRLEAIPFLTSTHFVSLRELVQRYGKELGVGARVDCLEAANRGVPALITFCKDGRIKSE